MAERYFLSSGTVNLPRAQALNAHPFDPPGVPTKFSGHVTSSQLPCVVISGGNPFQVLVFPEPTDLAILDAAQSPLDSQDATQVQAAQQARANQTTIQQNVLAALTNLETLSSNWGSLTAAQKDQATLLVVRMCARLVRLLLNQTSSNGV